MLLKAAFVRFVSSPKLLLDCNPMKAAWASILVVSRVITLLAAIAGMVFIVAGFFTGNSEWGIRAILLMCIFSLPDAYSNVAQGICGPKPRPLAHLSLTRWPLLLLPFTIPALFGWVVWFGFGRAWMGTLVAFGGGLPMIALLASAYLMEPGPRKDRVYLASTVAMLAAPLLMVVTFAVVYGGAGR
jgi:hypothetical protein